MKIYKYTSLSSAIHILRDGGVVLNNPKIFNDPNDCSFVQSKSDKEKIEKLITNYFVYKTLSELASSHKNALNKTSRIILVPIQKEMNAMKKILRKNPYFERIPGFKLIAKTFESKSEEINSSVTKAKKDFENLIEEIVKNVKENALISCFSKRNNSVLMWSHYANSHKGVCIEYERPETTDFKDVKYRKNRPSIKMYKAVSHAIALDILGNKVVKDQVAEELKTVLDPFFIKSTDWRYEEEVRCLYSNSKLNEGISFDGEKYTLNMGYPTAIYVGCKASGDELDHLVKLATNRGIPVLFMKKSEQTFDLVVDEEYKYIPEIKKDAKEITLLHLISDINSCLNSKIYLVAFAASFIVPGICSQVECSHISDPKERYIAWCNKCLPCADRDPEGEDTPCITGEVLWKIKEKLFTEGNIDVCGDYEKFTLDKLALRIEERKGYGIYADAIDEKDVTINITKFCTDMIFQAERCYRKHQAEVEALAQLPIDDYDAISEMMSESAIVTKRSKRPIKEPNKSH